MPQRAFFDSAYGNRDASPALLNEGVREATSIALRISHAGDASKTVDFTPLDTRMSVKELSGIEFLLMIIPAIAAALILAEANTTVRIRAEQCPRLDSVIKDPRWPSFFWINRRHALGSHTGTVISIIASAPPLARAQMEAWMKGEYPPLSALARRGLLKGVQKCRGLFGFSLPPQADRFQLVLALPI